MHTNTSGGSSDTEANEFAVKPRGVPSASRRDTRIGKTAECFAKLTVVQSIICLAIQGTFKVSNIICKIQDLLIYCSGFSIKAMWRNPCKMTSLAP